MKKNKLPRGWTEEKVKKVIRHYESQSEDEAVAEDEAAFAKPKQTVMEVPRKLVPKVRALIAKSASRHTRAVG